MQSQNTIHPLIIRPNSPTQSQCSISFLVVTDGTPQEKPATNVLTEEHVEAMVSRWHQLRCPVVDLRGKEQSMSISEVRELALKQLG